MSAAGKMALTWLTELYNRGGIEALKKELKFRGVTGIKTSLAAKDLGKAGEAIKEMTLDTITILALAVLHDDFGFGEKRCQKFMDGMDRGAQFLVEDLATWPDYIESIKEQMGIDVTIRWNDEDKKVRL